MKTSIEWDKIVTELKKDLSEEIVDKWLKNLSIDRYEENTIYLTAQNIFKKKWVEDNYIPNIKEAIKNSFNITDRDIDVVIILNNERESNNVQTPVNYTHFNNEEKDVNSVPLNKEYTFDNFVAGRSNVFAYSVCTAASQGFDSAHNPIYIYGNIGLGKTHLMHATGNQIRINNPKYKVICTTPDLFVKEYVNALSRREADKFKDKYISADVLLFDDVQFIAKGEATLNEFFSIFSYLYNNNKQIILTSNSMPENIQNIDSRLSSRFRGGIMVEISKPSIDEKIAIINKYINRINLDMSDEIIRFIAENIKYDNTRDLVGLIINIRARVKLQKAELTLDYITENFNDFFIEKNKVYTADDIIEKVSSYFNIKPNDLKSTSRAKSIVIPRNIAIYIMHTELENLTLSSIGQIFKRDHSTILNSIKKIKTEIENKNDYTVKTIENIYKQLKQ